VVTSGGQKAKQEKARRMVEDFQKFIDKYPESEEALDAMHLMGINYQAELILNQPEKAIEVWKRMRGVARKLGRAQPELSALRMLGYTYREMGRDDDELSIHREVLTLPLGEDEKTQLQARIYALENLRVGRKPIPFPPTVADLEGNPISLDDLIGKVVLIDFWSSEVPQCLGDLEPKKDAYKKFKDRGFEIISVSMEMERPALKNIVEDYRVTWPQYFNKKCPGWNNDLLKLYTVHRLPATFLVDRKGILRYKNRPGADLPGLVEKLVEER
jgi:peroxiredoxin